MGQPSYPAAASSANAVSTTVGLWPYKQVQILVDIDNIPTIIHGSFVNKVYEEWGTSILYPLCIRLAGDLIYKVPSKKAWSAGSVGLKDTFDVDYLVKRLKFKTTSKSKSIIINDVVDAVREINLSLSESGKSDLLKLDRFSFTSLTSPPLDYKLDKNYKTQDIG